MRARLGWAWGHGRLGHVDFLALRFLGHVGVFDPVVRPVVVVIVAVALLALSPHASCHVRNITYSIDSKPAPAVAAAGLRGFGSRRARLRC